MSDAIESGGWLPRYMAGEHEAVWREMVALGAEVRAAPYFDAAWAVARETMRRARHNVELIVRRLDAMGYEFWNGEVGSLAPSGIAVSIGGRVVSFDSPMDMVREAMARDTSGMHPRALEARQHLMSLTAPFEAAKAKADAQQRARIETQAAISDHLKDPLVFAPPTADQVNRIRGLEAKGMFLPLSWRAWIEEVGDVNFAGAHPALCFWDRPGFAGVHADPLMVTQDHLHFELETWQEQLDDGETPEGFEAIIAWEPEAKARLAVEDQQLDFGYAIALPDPAADAPVRLGHAEVGFVDYLRTAFRWGGFPGWAGNADPPRRELAQLTEGLLPL